MKTRRIIGVSLILCLIFSMFTACGENDSSGDENRGTKADVDLTILGNIIAYAKVKDMFENPDKYIGDTVRAAGEYTQIVWEQNNNSIHHYVVVEGSEDCCPQLIELRWETDEYPNEGDIIEIFGIYERHNDYNQPWYRIAVEDEDVIRY